MFDSKWANKLTDAFPLCTPEKGTDEGNTAGGNQADAQAGFLGQSQGSSSATPAEASVDPGEETADLIVGPELLRTIEKYRPRR